MKKFTRIAAKVAAGIVLLLLVLLFAVQIPVLQKKMVLKVMQALEVNFQGKMNFSSFSVSGLNTLVIKDLVITDTNPYVLDTFKTGRHPLDTLFSAENVSASFTPSDLLNRKDIIRIQRVRVDNACLNLVLEPDPDFPVNATRIFRIEKRGPEFIGLKDIFNIRRVEVNNFRYRMVSFMDMAVPHPGVGIDWFDMDLTASCKARNFRWIGESIFARIEELKMKEKSGCELNGSAYVNFISGDVLIGDVHLWNRDSDVNLDYYRMSFNNRLAFSQYVDSVTMHASIRPSRLSMKTLKYFTGVLPDCTLDLDFAGGEWHGPTNALELRNVALSTGQDEEKSSLTLDGTALNLANDKTISLDAALSNSRFTGKSLGMLINSFLPQDKAVDLAFLAPGEDLNLDITVKGELDSLCVNADLHSAAGNAAVRAEVLNLGTESPLKVLAKAETDRLDISRFASVEQLKELSLKLNTEIELLPSPKIEIRSLEISRLHALDYTYSGIRAKGTVEDLSFNGTVDVNDPNLKLHFSGLAGIPSKSGDLLYHFTADLRHANLDALGFDRRDLNTSIASKIKTEFRRTSAGNIYGEILFTDMNFSGIKGSYSTDKARLSAHIGSGRHRIIFNSEFLDASYTGDCSIIEAGNKLASASLKPNLPAVFQSNKLSFEGQNIALKAELHQCADLLSVLLPGTYIAGGTLFNATLAASGAADISLGSEGIAIGRNYIKGIDAGFSHRNGPAQAYLNIGNLSYSNIELDAISIQASAADNTMMLSAGYHNSRKDSDGGSLNIENSFYRTAEGKLAVDIKPVNSWAVFNAEQWRISESPIKVRNGEVLFKDFTIASDYGHLTLNGGISSARKMTLSLDIHRFGLNIINTFLGGVDLHGELYGEGELISPVSSKPDIKAKLVCLNTAMAGIELGELSAKANTVKDRLEMDLSFKNNGQNTIKATGSYDYSTEEISADLSLNGFNPVVFKPFTQGAVSEIEGSINGKLSARGPLASLMLSSDGIEISDAHILLPMTGIPYYISGKVSLDTEGVLVDSIEISDAQGGSISLAGRPEDIRIDIDRFRVMDKADDGSPLWGSIYASGSAGVHLGENGVNVEADLSIPRESKLHVAPSFSQGSESSSILEFVEPEMTEEEYFNALLEKPVKQNHLNYSAKARLNASPNLELLIDLDKESGNVINAKGEGIITAELRPGGFSVGGDYNISEGKYHFSALNIATRDFIIRSGSSMKFVGDPMETELDLNAVHTLKTSLSSLISDTTSVSTRRLVECGIHIKDKLKSPGLEFSIDVPDLDPTTKSMVESALNTEDKIQKQFIALIVTGSFLPSEQNGIVNNTGSNIVYSNLSSIMSGQLNNILQKFDIPVDLGLSYQQNEAGTDIFDVAVSTQFFDNRVVVNGSMGNRQYSVNGNDDMVGDVDVQIKLDNAGKVRLNVFSHSADEYTSYLDNTQRNGVGITYQQEYNKFSDFLRRLFMSRKEKEQADYEKAMKPEQRTRIVIE